MNTFFNWIELFIWVACNCCSILRENLLKLSSHKTIENPANISRPFGDSFREWSSTLSAKGTIRYYLKALLNNQRSKTWNLYISLICRMEPSCLDLALEGERLCKTGDYRSGVLYFESALQVGTEDLQILSAIYSQLGNAYFHLQEYNKALEYHRHDLTLTR